MEHLQDQVPSPPCNKDMHTNTLMQKTLKQLHLHEPRQINEPVATSKGKGMQLTKAI